MNYILFHKICIIILACKQTDMYYKITLYDIKIFQAVGINMGRMNQNTRANKIRCSKKIISSEFSHQQGMNLIISYL